MAAEERYKDVCKRGSDKGNATTPYSPSIYQYVYKDGSTSYTLGTGKVMDELMVFLTRCDAANPEEGGW